MHEDDEPLQLSIRFSSSMLRRIDAVAQGPVGRVSRPQAIRRLVERMASSDPVAAIPPFDEEPESALGEQLTVKFAQHSVDWLDQVSEASKGQFTRAALIRALIEIGLQREESRRGSGHDEE